MTFAEWKLLFAGALGCLSDDLEWALEVAEMWSESDINLSNDCPLESARLTWDDNKAEFQAGE